MARGAQSGGSRSPVRIAMGVVSAVVIVALAVYLVRTWMGSSGKDDYNLAYYVCDGCGEHFAAARGLPPVECPKCKKKTGVLLSWKKCGQCGHVYEGERYSSVPGREKEFYPERPGELPVQQMKYKDGEWMAPGSEEGVQIIRELYKCPKCGSKKIGLCPPPSRLDTARPDQTATP